MSNLIKYAVSLTVAVVSCLFLGINCFAAKIVFEDNADLYTDEQEQQLMSEQQELCDYTGWNIAVITTNIDFPTDGYDAVEYAESRYKELFGSYEADGILYLIDLGYRHFAIGGEPDLYYFNDYRVNKMLDRCEDKYYDYDDMGNVREYFNCVRKYYDDGAFTNSGSYPVSDGNYSGSANYPLSEVLMMSCVAGLIAAGIGVAVVLTRYKFHSKTNAACYIRSGGVDMYESSDIFIRESVTKTKNESGSGGGGGGSHHGSSGGHSMGGGGRGGHR